MWVTFSVRLRSITEQCQALGLGRLCSLSLALQPLVSLCFCDDTHADRVPQLLLMSLYCSSQTGHAKHDCLSPLSLESSGPEGHLSLFLAELRAQVTQQLSACC